MRLSLDLTLLLNFSFTFLVAVWLWMQYLTSQSLSFLVRKMRVVKLNSQGSKN